MIIKYPNIYVFIFLIFTIGSTNKTQAQSNLDKESIDTEISYIAQLIKHDQYEESIKKTHALRIKIEGLSNNNFLNLFDSYKSIVSVEVFSNAMNDDFDATMLVYTEVLKKLERFRTSEPKVSNFYDLCVEKMTAGKDAFTNPNTNLSENRLPDIETQSEFLAKEYQNLVESYERINTQKDFIIPDPTVKNYDYFHNMYRRAYALGKIEMYHQSTKLYLRGYEEMNANDIRNDLYPMFLYKLYENYKILRDVDKAFEYLSLFTRESNKPYNILSNSPANVGDVLDRMAHLLYEKKEYNAAITGWSYLVNDYVPNQYKGTNFHMIYIGNAFKKLNNIDKAIEFHGYFLEDARTSLNASLNHFTPYAYYLVGNDYLIKKDYNNAKINLEKSYYYYSNKDYMSRYKSSINGNKGLAKKFGFKEKERMYSRGNDLMLLHKDLAELYLLTGDLEKAIFHATEHAILVKSMAFDQIVWEVEQKKKGQVKNNIELINNINSFLSRINSKPNKLTSLAYEYALLAKSQLLKTAKYIRKNAITNEVSEVNYYYNQWLDTKNKTSSYLFKNKDSLIDFERFYEKHFLNLSKSSFRSLHEDLKVDWKLIQKALDKNEVAIEFITYDDNFEDSLTINSLKYAALIITKECEYPIFKELFNDSQLNNILSLLKNDSNSTEGIKGFYKKHAVDLYELIWRPLKPYIKGSKKVSFSLIGKLNALSLSAFKNPTNDYLLSKEIALNRVSTTKNLIRKKNNFTNTNIEKALIFGDINYNTNAETYSIDNTQTRGTIFQKLEGSKLEIEKISDILETNNIQYDIFSDSLATEDMLYKAIKNKANVVHIATHAFYLPSNQEFSTEYAGEYLFREEGDPMNRSSLVFSGANYFWKFGEKSVTNSLNDGIITANELSRLDFSEVDLVVLSACETGMGDISNSEGVYGLQRALNIAGAKNTIVSLWKVDDKVTQEYMVEFYDNLLNKNLPIEVAYSKTQESIRLKYPNPYYWSAFVLIQ